MKNSPGNISSEKENNKVRAGKKPGDNEVREGQNNSSIYDEGSNKEDKQNKEQPEFIDNTDETPDQA